MRDLVFEDSRELILTCALEQYCPKNTEFVVSREYVEGTEMLVVLVKLLRTTREENSLCLRIFLLQHSCIFFCIRH